MGIAKRRGLIGAACVLPCLNATSAWATTYYGAQGTTGDWSSSSTWVTTGNSATATNAGTVPTASNADTAEVAPIAGYNETVGVTDSEGASLVYMDPAAGQTATLNVSGAGILTVTSTLTSNSQVQHDDGTSVINVSNGGTIDLTNTGTALDLGYNTTAAPVATMNIGAGGTAATFNVSGTSYIENYSSATVNLLGGTWTATGATTYIAYGNYNATTGNSTGTVNINGGTANFSSVSINRCDNGGETGLLDLISGTFNTTGLVNVGSAGGTAATTATNNVESATLEVTGSTMTAININTAGTSGSTGLSLVPGAGAGHGVETDELLIGLDAGGSTLINVTGGINLTGSTLDVDTLSGYTGAGDVAGEPGWYRLASYTGALTGTPTLTSDDGLSYTLVNDPGYLTIQVASVPEPACLGVVAALAGLALRRHRRRS